MNRLDLATLPLHGTHLIEASAGTGKTYSIAALYERLLVDRGLGVDQIAVVTFTHAATAELRERIRARVGEALRREDVEPAAVERLRAALREIDTAAIHTIHGFCQRVLRDHAFDSGVPFETVLLTDEQPLLREIASDLWVRATHEAPEALVRHLAARAVDVERVLTLAAVAARTPGIRVLPDLAETPGGDAVDRAAIDAAARPCRAAFARAAAAWAVGRAAIETLLCDVPGLNRGSYKAATIRGQWLPELDGIFATDDLLALGRFEKLHRLTNDGLAERTNKGHAPPSHAFFDACQAFAAAHAELLPALDAAVVGFQRRAVDAVAAALAERKARANALGYGDLLTRLDRALDPAAGRSAEHLAAQLRARFPAALIDEFQDTDPIQYRIFQRIYGAAGAGSRAGRAAAAAGDAAALFLIGDPKQAIYAFRGADVFAYLNAARATPAAHRWTLDRNYRSDPGLVAAVNGLFDAARVPRPFVFDAIGFHPVKPRDGAIDRLAGPPRRTVPLELLVVRRDGGIPVGKGDRITADTANHELPRLVAGEIRRQLDAGVTLREVDPRTAAPGPARPIAPGDVAVLVRTNDQAARMQAALRRLRIPSVLHSESSVLDTVDAAELEQVVAAMVDPTDGGAVRSALATALLGCDAVELLRLQADEAAWDARAGQFQAWHDLWRDHGFIQAFRRLLDDEGVAARLLALPDGERRMTNVLHLGELLHTAGGGRLGMLALARWFGRVRHDPTARSEPVSEAALLRLESDARAVRIVTVHRAKGLEYPIVYCPFLWSGSRPARSDGKPAKPDRQPKSRGWWLYHDPRAGHAYTLSLLADDPDARAQAEREAFAEDLRLLYVAVTRALHRCSVVWGPFNGAERSALAYLLYAGAEDGAGGDGEPRSDGAIPADAGPAAVADAVLDQVAARAAGDLVDDDTLARGLRDGIVAAAGGAVAVAPLPFEAGEAWVPPLDAAAGVGGRAFGGRIDRHWRAASFSSLAHADEAAGAAAPAPAEAAPETADESGRDHDAAAEVDDDGGSDAAGGLDHPSAPRIARATGPAAGGAAAGPLPGGGPAAGADTVPLDALPAGASAGNVIHTVLEQIDFATVAAPKLREAVARALPRHGLDAEPWADIVAAALGDVLDTPLVDDAPRLTLRAIPKADRITEMEFTFPVAPHGEWPVGGRPGRDPSGRAAMADPAAARVTPARLAAALAAGAGPGFPAGYADRVRDLGFPALAGFLRGYVDLAFRHAGRWYLVDYKSNRLGPTYDHYAPDRLAGAMLRHHYVLQYHLYTVALHRFLGQRLGAGWDYGRDFGGVLYLFVRGMHPSLGPRRGVFFDRPPEALVERLSGLFDDPAHGGGRGAAR